MQAEVAGSDDSLARRRCAAELLPQPGQLRLGGSATKLYKTASHRVRAKGKGGLRV